MFDGFSDLIVVFLAGVAAACISCLPLLLHRMATINPGRNLEESWRDTAPLVFRISRRINLNLIRMVDKRLKTKSRDSLARKLQESGLYYAITPAEVIVMRWMLTGGVALFALTILWAYDFFQWHFVTLALCVLPIAYFYIDFWLRDEAKRRKQRIEKDFPFFLDVLVLSMKAGLAFPGAIQQATTQLPDGPIKQELSRLIREVRTGTSRSEGLQKLAKRIRLASVSNFVAVVAQADESGGSLTKSLHEQARQRRRERFQRAEKLANQAPVKMLFPLVAFLFPVTFIIIGFPLYEQLSGSGFFG